MRAKFKIAWICLAMLVGIRHSISQTLLRAQKIGNTGEDYGYAIVSDPSNNVYILGTFEGTVDMDAGAGTYNLTSRGGSDVFLCKYNSSGAFVWAVDIGGAGTDMTGVINTAGGGNLAVDASGNTYIIGQYSGTTYFDAALTVSVTSQGGQDVFFAKYDASGNCVWAKGIGGTGSEYCGGIDVDGSGNVAVCGFFDSNPVDCEPGTGSFIIANASGAAFDGFHAKYDGSGNCLWAYALAGAAPSGGRFGSPNMYACSVAFDASGNVIFTGTYAARCIFGAINLDEYHDFDVYMVKYNSAGTIQWAKSMGGPWFDYPTGITTDASDNIYIIGKIAYAGDFDPGVGTLYLNDPDNVAKVVTITLTGSSGTANITIGNEMPAKAVTFNTDLATTASDFVTSWGADYPVGGLSVTSSGADLIFTSPFAGWDFSASISNTSGDLSGTPVVTTAAVYNGGNLFIGKYNSSGEVVWAKNFNNGGSGDSGIGLNSTGDVLVAGTFSGTHDLDPGAPVATYTSTGGSDVMMSRFSNDGDYKGSYVFGSTGNDGAYFISTDALDRIYIAGSFQNTIDFNPIGTRTLTSNGGTDALFASFGAVALPVEFLSLTGELDHDVAHLTWTTASESNNDYFTVERNDDKGNWVETGRVKGKGFSSTLSTYHFNDTELPNVESDLIYRIKQTDFNGNYSYSNSILLSMNGPVKLNLFPNPSKGEINISYSATNQSNKPVLIVVRDVLGQEFYSKVLTTESEGILRINTEKILPSGIYYVVASSADKTVTGKLIIK